MKRVSFKKNKKKVFLSIGNFDGVHLGHQKILNALIKKGKDKDVEKAVLTFSPHPVKALSPRKIQHLLTSLRHKMRMIFEMGIENIYIMEFDQELARMKAEDFVKYVIKEKLNVCELFVGENFAIGPKKQGAIRKLMPILKRQGIKLNVIKTKKIKGKPLSSTLIRKEVISGRIKNAEKFLGKKYSVLGTIVRGEGIGRIIGFATANINPHNEIIPLTGVYIVDVLFEKKRYNGLVNIGYRPTVQGRKKTIEVHILDFNRNIYGKDIEIFFVKRLRNEKHFKNVEHLKKQISKDIAMLRKQDSERQIL